MLPTLPSLLVHAGRQTYAQHKSHRRCENTISCAGDVPGFKHVQLELMRAAAQDLLTRLAPELTAQLQAIFRVHTRQPAFSAGSHAPASPAAGPASSALPDIGFAPGIDVHSVVADTGVAANADMHTGLHAAALSSMGQTPSAAALAATTQPLLHGDPASSTSGALFATTLSHVGFEPLPSLPQPRASIVSFTEMASPQSFSSAHFPTGRPSRLSQLPTIRSMVPTVDIPTGEVSPPVVVAGQETPRSMASVRVQAEQMLQQVGQDAKHGHLLVLQPMQTVLHSSHVLVMRGALKLEGRTLNSQLAPGVMQQHCINACTCHACNALRCGVTQFSWQASQ